MKSLIEVMVYSYLPSPPGHLLAEYFLLSSVLVVSTEKSGLLDYSNKTI